MARLVQGRHPSGLSRGAYGANEGVLRIRKLLDKYDMPATFFIREIGHHGYCHEPPPGLDEPAEREMIERGIDALQRQLGVTPKGYRSPAWELSLIHSDCWVSTDSSTTPASLLRIGPTGFTTTATGRIL